MKQSKFLKVLMFIAFGAIAVLVFGGVVMWLWNAILPEVLGVKAITFVQALGILLLSKILFGGFHRKHEWKRKMQDKWNTRMEEKLSNMTPEEREKFKAEWKNRCGGMGWMKQHQYEEQQRNPM